MRNRRNPRSTTSTPTVSTIPPRPNLTQICGPKRQLILARALRAHWTRARAGEESGRGTMPGVDILRCLTRAGGPRLPPGDIQSPPRGHSVSPQGRFPRARLPAAGRAAPENADDLARIRAQRTIDPVPLILPARRLTPDRAPSVGFSKAPRNRGSLRE